MSLYEALDFFDVADLLTDDERAIQTAAREFVDEELMPIIEHHFAEGTFPTDVIPKMAEMGFLGANVEGYGCTSLGPVGYGVLNQELERCDSGIRSFVSVQSSLVIWPIFTYGSEAQKQRWLPALAGGTAVGCFGLTEPDFGSNPGGMLTNAKDDGDAYILNGRKMWITNGTIADVAVVWAKLDGEIRGFLVEKGTPGFSAPLIKNKFSLRASVTSELVFQDCRIPKSALLPEAPPGLKGPLQCLSQARFGIAWGTVGAAQACFDEALRYTQERVQFTKPLAGYQLVQKKLADMATEITKAQLLALRLGRLKEQGKVKFWQVSMAKMNNTKIALDAARAARDMLGASGICYDYGTARHLCNLESVFTYEGTHDIHALIIGETLTGHAAYAG
jgi:glutaryl-CoA dehydrogenase